MTGFELLVCGFIIGALIAHALTAEFAEQDRKREQMRRRNDR